MPLPVTITGLSTAVAVVGPYKVDLPALVIGGSAGGQGQFGRPPGTGVIEKIAQTFLTGSSPVTVSSVIAAVCTAFSPSDGVVIEIRLTDYNGSVVATSDAVPASALSATLQSTTFTFSSPPVLSASTVYCFVVRRTGSLDLSNYYELGLAATAYANGDGYRLSGTGWGSQGSDYFFNIPSTTNSAYYFFGRNGTTATTLSAYKATDPTASWASIATKTGFTTAILNLQAYQVGTTIHLLVQDGTASTSLATKYVSFDALTDTFLATTETVRRRSLSRDRSLVLEPAHLSLSARMVRPLRSTRLAVKTSGTFRMRVYYRRRTGVNTWSTETQVDANTAFDNQYSDCSFRRCR